MKTRHTPRPLSELALAHAGRPAVVIGGGMSLPKQIALTPADAVRVAANQHAGVMGYQFDYVVAVDNDIEKIVRPFGRPIITPRRWGDYQIFGNTFHSSGVTAAYVAWVMGCAPVILVAMDCFVGGTYCHDPKARSSGTAVSVDKHLTKWARLLKACPGAAFRSAGGPTATLWPLYDPSEPVAPAPNRADILRAVSGIWIEVRNPVDFLAGRKVGDRVEVSPAEARHAIGKRFAAKVAGELRP